MFRVTIQKKVIWIVIGFLHLENERYDKKVFKFYINLAKDIDKRKSRDFFLSKKSIRHFHSKPFTSVY